MTTTRKPGRPIDLDLAERRRTAILDAAAKLFAAHGYAQADTQQLADAVQVSKGTVFRYFPTKRELFEASIERSLDRLRQTVDAAANAVADPLQKLLAAMTAYLRFFDEHPEVVELLILERAEFKGRKSSYFDHKEKCTEADDGWLVLLAGLITDGRFRNIPTERIKNVLGDLLYGAMFSNHMSGRTRALESQAHDLFDIVFHGLLTDAERSRGGIARHLPQDAPGKSE